jgi:hypothetical protein
MASVAMDRLRKQDLLLLNVRCMGVQPEEFVRYIASIKGDSFDNLDAWDIAELRDAIEAFKQSS